MPRIPHGFDVSIQFENETSVIIRVRRRSFGGPGRTFGGPKWAENDEFFKGMKIEFGIVKIKACDPFWGPRIGCK